MGLARCDDRHYTYADYTRWPEDTRYELIDGVAYAKSGPDLAHQEIVGDVFRQLANALQGHPCRAFVAPFDVRLPKAGEADAATETVVQPDVLVVCDPAKLDRPGVCGAPDLVVEVLSPATASHDQVRKRRVYERACRHRNTDAANQPVWCCMLSGACRAPRNNPTPSRRTHLLSFPRRRESSAFALPQSRFASILN